MVKVKLLYIIPTFLSGPPSFPGLQGLQYSLHELGGRDSSDPLARLQVARTSKGWHCPHCLHVSTTKGNLKSHIVSGRHKNYEKAFECHFCRKTYSTRQSLQVHISTNHREERDRESSQLVAGMARSLAEEQRSYGVSMIPLNRQHQYFDEGSVKYEEPFSPRPQRHQIEQTPDLSQPCREDTSQVPNILKDETD